MSSAFEIDTLTEKGLSYKTTLTDIDIDSSWYCTTSDEIQLNFYTLLHNFRASSFQFELNAFDVVISICMYVFMLFKSA